MTRTKRTRVRVLLDAALLREARALGVDVSQGLEAHLRKVVREERARRWLEDNREAFAAANRFIEQYGIFNADDREW